MYSRLTDEEMSKFMDLPGHELILYYIKVDKDREKDRNEVKMNRVVILNSDLGKYMCTIVIIFVHEFSFSLMLELILLLLRLHEIMRLVQFVFLVDQFKYVC